MRLPHRNTASVQLPATRDLPPQRSRSIRVPGESEDTLIHPRPRSADLTTQSLNSLPSQQRAQPAEVSMNALQHSLCQPCESQSAVRW